MAGSTVKSLTRRLQRTQKSKCQALYTARAIWEVAAPTRPSDNKLPYKNCKVLKEKTPESSLDCKKIKPVHPKGNQSRMFIGGTDAESEAPDMKN